MLSAFIVLLFAISCNDNASQQNENNSNTPAKKFTNSRDNIKDADNISMTQAHEMIVGKFKIVYGYLKYDENEFGFSNPGYMHIFKGNQLIFEDSFQGEGPVYVESLGYQELAGKKLVFKLNHGTDACDYTSYARYYVSFDNKIYFLNEYFNSTGGDQYASHFYEHILPKDSAGIANYILIVEGLIFHEHDQPNLFDTTYIKFSDKKFNISKPTNNLDKAK